MSSSVPVYAVVLMAAAVSAPAWSQPAQGGARTVSQVRVPVGDLDLSRPDGADELLRRVSHAAARACGGQPAVGVLMVNYARAYRACQRKAVADTIDGVDVPMVRQRYAERTGQRPVEVAEGPAPH